VAELTPIPAAQRPSDPAYQPVSGYAVAAAITAGVFALALIGLVAAGLWYRRTPLSYEVLVLPIAGFVLAIVARSHIRNAEGTRTGVRLANASWWVCVLGGAGFWAFLQAVNVVMTAESKRPADAFFEALKSGKEHEAFERFILPPELRGRADPDSPDFEAVYTPFGYAGFDNCDLVHVFRINGANVQVEHIGSKDVGTEGNGFRATHVYRLTFTEGVADIQVKMVAAETRTGSKPEWHVQLMPALGITKPTWVYISQYGRLEADLSDEAHDVAHIWMVHLTSHQPGLAHGETLPPEQRKAAAQTIVGVSVLAGGPVLAAPVAPDGPAGVLAVDDLLKSRFFRSDDAGSPFPEAKVAKLREVWASPTIMPASPTVRHPSMLEPGAAERPTFTVTPKSVTIGIQADIIFNTAMQHAPATVGLECTDPEVVRAVNDAKARGPAAKDDGSVTLRTLKPRDWRVVWVRTNLETPVQANPAQLRGPGGPGGGRGPGGP
jgi:hypothetical protein